MIYIFMANNLLLYSTIVENKRCDFVEIKKYITYVSTQHVLASFFEIERIEIGG